RIGSGKAQRVFSRERLNTDPAGEKTRSINKDLVLLVAWKNPYLGTGAPRRGMMFAGFTGLGNNAAAQYLSKDLAQGHSRYRKRCRDHGLPHLYSSRWPMFLAVLEAEIHGRSVGEIKELHFEAIPDGDK